MTKHAKHIAALLRKARLATDPVKRHRIMAKIRELEQKKSIDNWLSQ